MKKHMASDQASETPCTRPLVWILGDSWGTPLGLPPHMQEDHDHLDGLLRQHGHGVENFARCAGSNRETIQRALDHDGPHPDYIVWFHTESLRDFEPSIGYFRIREAILKHAQLNYEHFKELLDKTGAKDVIIGGQAPVIPSLLVHSPYHIIVDWRGELLDMPSMMTHSVCHTYLFEHLNCKDTPKNRLRILEQNERILDAERASADFPDDCHPGGVAHRELFGRISNLMC